MYGQSGSFGNLDQNVTRLIEETVNSVEDVERRLTGLKIGIAQTFPQLAPILQARELQHREQNAIVLARLHGISQLPYGVGVPGLTGIPLQGMTPMMGQNFLPTNVNVGQGFLGHTPSIFPGTPFPGGIQGGVSSLGSPFRFW